MSGVKQYGATAADGGYAAATLPLSGTEGLLVRQSDAVLFATAQDIANLATGGASGDIVAGTNISLSGTATGRLKGAGSLTVNATSPTGTGYTHITAGVRDAAASSAATVAADLINAGIKAPNVQSVTSSATVTPTFSNDLVKITAQAAALALANPTGTAVPGWGIVIRIKDNGTARAISYGSQYRAIGVTLPTTTVINKTLYLGMIYNSDDTRWDVLSVAQEA